MLKSIKWNDNNNNYIPVTTATIYACFILSHRIRFCSFDGNTRPLQSSILHNDFYSSVIYFAGAGFFSPSYTQKAHVSFLNKTQHTVDVLRFLNFAESDTVQRCQPAKKTKQNKKREKKNVAGEEITLFCVSPSQHQHIICPLEPITFFFSQHHVPEVKHHWAITGHNLHQCDKQQL